MGDVRLLRADEIDARIQSVNKGGARVLLYKNARCDMNILDETFGTMNWQRKHELINGRLFCSVGVYDSRTDQWVWRQDVGKESNTEKEKGQASDAFKRACVNWGIGRELYTAPDIFFFNQDLDTYKTLGENRFSCFDNFRVVDIGYTGRSISYVKILNENTGRIHTFQNAPKQSANAQKSKPKSKPKESQKEIEQWQAEGLNESQKLTIVNFIKKKGKTVDEVLQAVGAKSVDDMTRKHYNKVITMLQGAGS